MHAGSNLTQEVSKAYTQNFNNLLINFNPFLPDDESNGFQNFPNLLPHQNRILSKHTCLFYKIYFS